MKSFCTLILSAAILAGVACAEDKPTIAKKEHPAAQQKKPGAPPATELKSTRQQASYAIGLNIGRSISRDGLEIDVDVMAEGLRDGIAGSEPRLTDEQITAAMQAFQQEAIAQGATRQKAAADKNAQESAAFLAANKKKKDVITLDSGLQYKVLKSGNGPSPKATDTVRTHYHGTLIDGSVFDSSVKRGEPISFPVNGVIKGWTEVLQRMKVGDKWQVFIPSDLAYGPTGSQGAIGPNQALVFEIELLGIE